MKPIIKMFLRVFVSYSVKIKGYTLINVKCDAYTPFITLNW